MMTKMPHPDISVIIPVFNTEKYLQKCLASVLAQTLRRIEVIIIDDGSTDKSGGICDEYVTRDCRVTVAHLVNGGVSRARNEGIRRARGRWIAFLDSDDTVEPDYLENLLTCASRSHTEGNALIVSGFSIIYDGLVERTEQIRWSKHVLDREKFGEAFLKQKIYLRGYPFGKLYNLAVLRRFAIQFDEQLRFCEDLIFMMDYLLHVDHLIFDDSCGYNYYCKVGAGLSKSYSSFELEYKFVSSFLEKASGLLGSGVADAALTATQRKFVLRAVSCLYRPATKVPRVARLRILRHVSEAHSALLAGAGPLHALLYYKLFYIYDTSFLILYAIRYGILARPWAWFCRVRA